MHRQIGAQLFEHQAQRHIHGFEGLHFGAGQRANVAVGQKARLKGQRRDRDTVIQPRRPPRIGGSHLTTEDQNLGQTLGRCQVSPYCRQAAPGSLRRLAKTAIATAVKAAIGRHNGCRWTERDLS